MEECLTNEMEIRAQQSVFGAILFREVYNQLELQNNFHLFSFQLSGAKKE